MNNVQKTVEGYVYIGLGRYESVSKTKEYYYIFEVAILYTKTSFLDISFNDQISIVNVIKIKLNINYYIVKPIKRLAK